MQKSDQINELAAALAKAQAEIKVAEKDVANNFFHSKYADLPEVVRVSRPALTKNGLAVIQVADTSENGMVLETILVHSSGQWVSSLWPINPTKQDPQGIMSAVTYARRGAYCAITGTVAGNEDDDGNAASDKQGSAIGNIMNPRTSGPSDVDAGLTRIGHFKEEGKDRASEGTTSLMNWWAGLLKSDQLKLATFKDSVLKPMAEAADRESMSA